MLKQSSPGFPDRLLGLSTRGMCCTVGGVNLKQSIIKELCLLFQWEWNLSSRFSKFIICFTGHSAFRYSDISMNLLNEPFFYGEC